MEGILHKIAVADTDIGVFQRLLCQIQALNVVLQVEGIVDNDAYYPGDITGGEVYKYLGSDIYKKFDDIFTAVKSK